MDSLKSNTAKIGKHQGVHAGGALQRPPSRWGNITQPLSATIWRTGCWTVKPPGALQYINQTKGGLYNEDASRHGLPPNRCNPFVNECIRPCPTPTALPFQKELSVRNTSGGRAPSSQPFLETTIFSLTVHAHSCCQSENIFFKCLLKRVIDPSVLNYSICYDNNANRITCQELFLDFFKNNKYDRLIK